MTLNAISTRSCATGPTGTRCPEREDKVHRPDQTPLRSVVGPNPDVQTRIYQRDVNLVIWRRQPDPALTAHCEDILQATPRTALRKVASVASLLTEPGEALPPMIAEGPIGTDIVYLTDMFACLFELDRVGIRLMSLDGAMCPRFHVDRVYCRLLVTYGGPGTQWLQTSALTRPWRDLLADAERGDLDAQQELKTWTHSIPCQGAALLKGEIWPDNEGHGAVHRSPLLEPGSKRLLFTLDLV